MLRLQNLAREQIDVDFLMHSYNPLTHSVHVLNPSTDDQEIPSLFSLSLICSRRSITLRNFHHLDTEQLPISMIRELCYLKLSDFHINPAHVNGEDHMERVYLATCLIDDSKTHLCITADGASNLAHSDPAYITSFEEDGFQIHVLDYTESLDQYLEKIREVGESLSEQRIWKTISDISKSIVQSAVRVAHPSRIRVFKDKAFYRLPFNSHVRGSSIMQIIAGNRTGIYEAPEMLDRKHTSDRTLSWTMGCIAYELATLEPAYYDRAGTGNMMSVVTDVIQAVPIPDISHYHSDDLRNIIKKCLQKSPSARPTMQDIIAVTHEHI